MVAAGVAAAAVACAGPCTYRRSESGAVRRAAESIQVVTTRVNVQASLVIQAGGGGGAGGTQAAEPQAARTEGAVNGSVRGGC